LRGRLDRDLRVFFGVDVVERLAVRALRTRMLARGLDRKGRGGAEVLERAPPERFRLPEILPPEPGDVVPIARRRRQNRVTLLPGGGVERRELFEQHRHRPAVEEEVV